MSARILFTACVSLYLIGSANAARSEIRICSGQEGGGYHAVGAALADRVREQNAVPAENIRTNGSADNLVKLNQGVCNYAIVQLDALVSNRKDELEDNIVDSVYLEPVHIFVNARNKNVDILRVFERGDVHGWRYNSGHLQSAFYLCHGNDQEKVCPNTPAYESGEANVGDEEILKIVRNKLLNEEINAIVFTSYKGHPIPRQLTNTAGINLVDTKTLDHDYEYYSNYVIEAGTYIEGNERRNEDGSRNAYTFATLAVIVSSSEATCNRDFKLLQGHLAAVVNAFAEQTNGSPSVMRDWYSLQDRAAFGVRARECQ